jgi:hypothetical protein
VTPLDGTGNVSEAQPNRRLAVAAAHYVDSPVEFALLTSCAFAGQAPTGAAPEHQNSISSTRFDPKPAFSL